MKLLLLACLLVAGSLQITQHTHGVIHTCRNCLHKKYQQLDKFINYDFKHFSDLKVVFNDSVLEPYFQTLTPDDEVVSMYDLSRVKLEDIRLLLLNSQFHPKEKLMPLKSVDEAYLQHLEMMPELEEEEPEDGEDLGVDL